MDTAPQAVPALDSSPLGRDGVPRHVAPLLDDGVFSPERMKAEREQAYFNDLYLLAPVAYFVLGLDGVILQVNLVAAELFGLARGHPGHVLFRSYVHEAFRHDYDQFVQRVLNSSEPERIQLQVQLPPPRPGAREAGLPVSLLGSAWCWSWPKASWPRSNAAKSASGASCTAPRRVSGKSMRRR